MLINNFAYFQRRANHNNKTCGMDTPIESYRTLEDWYAYPVQNFNYSFNSWGFRGPEYEQFLDKPINLCLGDSFTVNVGGPIEHSWCSQLAKHFDIPTINVGVDGAGNDAIRIIYEKACNIFDIRDVFVMYSFLHRRLNKNFEFTQDTAKMRDNFKYFIKQRIENVYEAALPSWCWYPLEKSFLKRLGIFTYTSKYDMNLISEERNRDGFHMSKRINKIYADYFYNNWRNNNDL